LDGLTNKLIQGHGFCDFSALLVVLREDIRLGMCKGEEEKYEQEGYFGHNLNKIMGKIIY